MPEMEEGFLYRSYLCSYVFMRSVSSTAIVRDTAEYHHAGMSFLPVYFTDVCSLLYCDTDFQDWGIYQCIYSDASAKRGHHSSGGDAPFCPDYPGRMADGESGAPVKRDGADMEKCSSSSAADDGIYAGPFLLQCSVIVDEMSAAVMARGFDKNMPRTSYAEVQMKALDWCIIAVSAGLLFWNLCF